MDILCFLIKYYFHIEILFSRALSFLNSTTRNLYLMLKWTVMLAYWMYDTIQISFQQKLMITQYLDSVRFFNVLLASQGKMNSRLLQEYQSSQLDFPCTLLKSIYVEFTESLTLLDPAILSGTLRALYVSQVCVIHHFRVKGWTWLNSKCYWTKKQLKPFDIQHFNAFIKFEWKQWFWLSKVAPCFVGVWLFKVTLYSYMIVWNTV